MKIALFTYTRQGVQTARRLLALFPTATQRAYAPARLAQPPFNFLAQGEDSPYAEAFAWADMLIFIGACGIAVRKIAPYLRSKETDPAVLCLDPEGTYVIPLLSGHIGQANRWAKIIARGIAAHLVLTTATDTQGKFAVDAWASHQGWYLDNLPLAKEIAAAILEQPLPLCSDFPIAGPLPPGTFAGESGSLGIYIGWQQRQPFRQTLRLIPPCLHLGIGCRRGTTAAAIEQAVTALLQEHGIDNHAICRVHSINLKAQEQGLIAYCAQQHWPLQCHSAAQLQMVSGSRNASAFVQQITGVDNVCERAALAGAPQLLIKKTCYPGICLALSKEEWEICFDEANDCGHRPRGSGTANPPSRLSPTPM